MELPESCSSLPRPPVNRGAEKRGTVALDVTGFYECRRGGRLKTGHKNCVIYTRMRRKICRKFSGQRPSFWRYCCGFFLFPWFFVAGSGLARVSYLGPFHRHSTQRAGSGRAVDTGPGIRVWTFAKKRGCARPRRLEKRHNYARKQKSTDQTVGAFLLMQAQHSGPSGESRTHGLLNPIQARYQTALHPDVWPGVLTGDIVYYSASLDRCQLFFQRIFKEI